MENKKEIRRTYNAHFKKELSRLNAAQAEAVNSIDGPVMVIAGPGTGKTHILTARIGRILMETDTLPSNILCLTFTDAGVHAMRERLLEFIGPEAHRVHIYTFHSFCNSIIQENLEVFGRHDMEPLSELEKVELIHELLDELPINHPLVRGKADRYFYTKHLSGLFDKMKQEAWTEAFIKERIASYLSDLPLRPDFLYQRKHGQNKKGDLKQVKFDEQVARMELLSAGIDLFANYGALMHRNRRYDYADMILWVLKAFKSNEALLRKYQEQYLYFLVDEYQDTNGSQNEIVQQLIKYWDNPNVFIVGDDDQSIYEFQGARLKNLTDFYTQFTDDLKMVLLKNNYRSSQAILDSAGALIGINEKRIVNQLASLGLEKKLKAAHPDVKKIKTKTQFIAYPNRLQEAVAIVQKIKDLHQADFPLDEVAIIYARHKQASDIITLLEKEKIPYETKKNIDILELPTIQQLQLLLEYLSKEYEKPFSGEDILFKILHFDFLKIASIDLAKLTLYQAQLGFDKRTMWRSLLNDSSTLATLQLANPEAISAFAELMNELISDVGNLPMPQLLERLINRTGLLAHILNQNDRTWQLQVLHTFLNFVKEETLRSPRIKVARLLEVLQKMERNRLALQVTKSVQAEAGVQLLTAHSSKGLEFEKVFIVDAVKDYWEKQGGGRGFTYPDTLTFSGEEDQVEARRRLFYVAMTRAKQGLYISFAKENNRGKDIARALFVDEVLEGMGLEIVERELPEAELLMAQAVLLSEPVEEPMKKPSKATLDGLLEGFVLTASSMNQYIKCPISFYYEKVLKVPVVASEAASYGNAMHRALERLFLAMQDDEAQAFPSVERLVRYFEQDMQRQVNNFSKKEYERRLEMGRVHLKAYYDLNIGSWHKSVQVENFVKGVELDGIPLKGVIDRVELHPQNTAHIVDYKTGSHNETKVKPPSGNILISRAIFQALESPFHQRM